jgi:hypothetical protein
MQRTTRVSRAGWVLLMLTLAALGVALWILRPESQPFGGVTTRTPEARPENAAAPVAEVPQPAPTPLAAPPAAWREDVGEEVRLVGRIVGPDRTPIAGAEITFLPSYALQREMHLVPLRSWTWIRHAGPVDGIPLAILPTARAEDDGRFALAARLLAGDRPRYFGFASPAGVLVLAPGWASRDLALGETPGDQLDLGEIALEPEVVLSGRAVDESGQALEGVEVRRLDASPEPRQSAEVWSSFFAELCVTHTDARGRFVFPGQWTGDIELALRAPGRVPTQLRQHLSVVGPHDAGDVVLRIGGVIEGLVVDDAGRPVPDAEILLTDDDVRTYMDYDVVKTYRPDDDAVPYQIEQVRADDWHGVARSGVDGRFRAEGLAADNQTLFVSAAGFDPARLAGVALGRTDVRVVLAREATLVVNVRDADTGAPLPDAKVSALRPLAAHEGSMASLWTEVASGAAAHAARPDTDFPPGRFLVRGAGAVQTWLVVDASGHAGISLLEPGHPAASASTLEVSLAKEAVLSGHVRDERGAAVTDAVLHWRSNGEPPVTREVATDQSGAWRVTGLRRDAQGSLRVEKPDFALMQRGVDLASDEARAGLELVLPRAADLHGRLLDSEGRPIARRNVECLPIALAAAPVDDVPRRHQAYTDDTGAFSFKQLQLGRYLLKAEGGGTAEVTLEPGVTADVEIRKPVTPRLVGRVTRNGQPVAGLWVSCRAEDAAEDDWHNRINPDQPETDADGGFAVWVPQGGAYLVKLSNRVTDAVERRVDVAAEGVTRVDIELPSSRIAGSVVSDIDGSPVVDVSLALERDGHAIAHAATQADGSFEFLGAGPGPWDVALEPVLRIALPDTGAETRHDVAGQRVVRRPLWRRFSVQVLVEEGRDPEPLRITACPGATLRGRVTHADGSPAVEPLRVEFVHFTPENGFDVGWQPEADFDLPTTAAVHCVAVHDGLYEAAALPEGFLRVRVVARAARPSDKLDILDHGQGVKLSEHETLTLDLVAPEP